MLGLLVFKTKLSLGVTLLGHLNSVAINLELQFKHYDHFLIYITFSDTISCH